VQKVPLLSLLLITFLAALVPLLSARFSRLRIPVVIGEILAGIVIGKSGLNLVDTNPILEFLAEFGFVFLMFISGLEVDLSSLMLSRPLPERRVPWQRPIFLALVSFGLTILGALFITFQLMRMGWVENFFILGLILGTTSLGIVVPILKERNIIDTDYGQLLLWAALLADFVTLVLLSLAFTFLKKGLALELILILLFLAIFPQKQR
jgi:Kef-type K+ transport system membrane component KefB